MNYKKLWLTILIIVITVGILSRTIHTGWLIFDKYLGDALYAILAYILLSLVWPAGRPSRKAWLTVFLMVAIETFQLTHIPLNFRLSDNLILNLISILLGTKFAWLDLFAYGVGIGAVYGLDHFSSDSRYERTVLGH